MRTGQECRTAAPPGEPSGSGRFAGGQAAQQSGRPGAHILLRDVAAAWAGALAHERRGFLSPGALPDRRRSTPPLLIVRCPGYAALQSAVDVGYSGVHGLRSTRERDRAVLLASSVSTLPRPTSLPDHRRGTLRGGSRGPKGIWRPVIG